VCSDPAAAAAANTALTAGSTGLVESGITFPSLDVCSAVDVLSILLHRNLCSTRHRTCTSEDTRTSAPCNYRMSALEYVICNPGSMLGPGARHRRYACNTVIMD
jgi:hypothetical protein